MAINVTAHPTQPAAPMSSSAMQRATSAVTGDAHSLAVSALVDLAKRQQRRTVAEHQTLLAFSSAPQPEGLSEGEWAERVNVILNALRTQPEVIGLAALRLAGDRGAKQDVRISALHTCVERKMADVHPAARQIAASVRTRLSRPGGGVGVCAPAAAPSLASSA